ncbi:MAG: hypothetical protein PVI86_18385 [Phycisphaerae bacterium]|jgi:hypothetical protein
MQAEIDQSQGTPDAPPVPIKILGVNQMGLESGNGGMTAGHVLPWLQPAAGEDIWTLWQVTYRDVYIVGPGNEHVATFNLTTQNLALPENYDALKDLLFDAAND